MRAIHRSWEPGQTEVLLYLRHLARGQGGYELRGVRGWAHRVDVEQGVGRGTLDLLPALHRRKLLDREEVRVPGGGAPVGVYRLNATSARALAERTGTAATPWEPPGPPDRGAPVYVARRRQRVLWRMRAAYDDPAAPRRFAERGWMTSREAGGGGENAVAELRGLHRGGLIERRNDAAARVREPVVYWRATEEGRRVRPLAWREPAADGASRTAEPPARRRDRARITAS